LANQQKHLRPDDLARLKLLEVEARSIVEGWISGRHKSPLRGFSVEFAEHREYAPGDDLRRLDWKVFGRTSKLHVKQFEQETNLTCQILVDASESMGFGTQCWQDHPQLSYSKFDHAAVTAVSLAHLLLQSGDSVGLTLYGEGPLSQVPVSGKSDQLNTMLEVFSGGAGNQKTRLAPVLESLAGKMSRRGIVLVFSDFLDDPDAVMQSIRLLVHRGHEVVAFHVLDPMELDLPLDGPVLFRGVEGDPSLDTDPSTLKKDYLEKLEAWRAGIENNMTRMGMDYLLLRTDEKPGARLAAYLRGRAGRKLRNKQGGRS
jgi:uncharacterized protein (DUF58 family)